MKMNSILNKYGQIKNITLKNGIAVTLIKTHHKIKIAHLVINAGSNFTQYEYNGEMNYVIPGSFHFIEHQLFKRQDGIDYFELFANLGLDSNAATTHNATYYFIAGNKNFTEGIKLLLEMVKNPSFDEKRIWVEKQIIKEEINMYASSPEQQMINLALQKMYENYPFIYDIAGSPSGVDDINKEHLEKVFEAFYTKENMRLVVAGNIDFEDYESILNKIITNNADNIENKGSKLTIHEVSEKLLVHQNESFEVLNVLQDKLVIGFKHYINDLSNVIVEEFNFMMLKYLIFAESSPYYYELLENNYIDPIIDDQMVIEGHWVNQIYLISAIDTTKLKDKIYNNLNFDYLKDYVSEKEFINGKKMLYGVLINRFNNLESFSQMIIDLAFNNQTLYDLFDKLDSYSYEDFILFLKRINNDYISYLHIIAN